MPYSQLSAVAAQVPDLQRQLLRVISREFVLDHEHLVMMGRRQAQERLAIFLRNLSERQIRLKRDPALLTLSMSRQEIANYLGLVIETVSRLFTRFQANGILAVKGKRVRIADFSALDELASGAAKAAAPDRRAASA